MRRSAAEQICNQKIPTSANYDLEDPTERNQYPITQTRQKIKKNLTLPPRSSQYLATAAVFEFTNPAPKTEKRLNSMKEEIKLGVTVTLLNVVFATAWMFWIEPHTPYYAWFETHEHNLKAFVVELAVYMLWADTWFYWTHRLLHTK